MFAYYVIFNIFFIKNWTIGFFGSTYWLSLVTSWRQNRMDIVWGVKKFEYTDMRFIIFQNG